MGKNACDENKGWIKRQLDVLNKIVGGVRYGKERDLVHIAEDYSFLENFLWVGLALCGLCYLWSNAKAHDAFCRVANTTITHYRRNV